MTPPNKIIDYIRNFRFLLGERSFHLAIIGTVLLIVTLAITGIFYPDRFVTILIDGIVSALFALIVLFVSYDLILQYGHSKERDRIADDEVVVDRYKDSIELLERASAPSWAEVFGGRQVAQLPFALEYVPDEPRQIDDIDFSVREKIYTFPERLSLVLDPVEDDQRERFQSEGHFNALKAGLEEIRAGEFCLRPESYFQAFRTTHSPDYEIYRGKSLRDLTDHMLLDENGLVPLSDVPFPNAFGGGGIVISADGRGVVPIRSGRVAYAAGEAEVSFGGSFDLSVIEDAESMMEQYQSELKSELGIAADEIIDTYCLGVVRRLELLGSPDMLVLVLVNEDVTFDNRTEENVRLIQMDLLPSRSGITPEELFTRENINRASRNLFEQLDAEGYLPGPALTATLALMSHHARERERIPDRR